MDNEKLVDMITREVMKRIPRSTANTATDKEKVLVINSCEEELIKVKNLLEHKYEIHVYAKEDINLKNYEHIVVTNLCNKGLAAMALGLCNDDIQEFIVETLFNGKKIYILEEGIQYRKYLKDTNKALYNLYNEYENKIISYGVNLVDEKNLFKSMQGAVVYSDIKTKVFEKPVQAHQVAEINDKKLITESDLRKAYMNGIKEVNLMKNAILTPLAQDFIRIKRLKINRLL